LRISESIKGKIIRKCYFECLGEDLSHVLLAEVASRTETVLDLCLFTIPFGRTTSGTRADGAAEDFWPPPPVYGALRVMEAQDRVRVSKSPGVRRLWETRDYVEGGKG